MINGEPWGHIQPARGICQGGPLSPYLFLLGSKGLNGLIQHEVNLGNLKGFSLCKHGPRISHLFFANDTLLFCQARLGDVQAIQDILILYEEASSQQINKAKTNLFFGKSVDATTKEYIKELLGVPENQRI